MDTWNPPVDLSAAELRLLKLCKKQKLWGFLRHYRHELLNDEVQAAMREMYADSGRGRPRSPSRLALALILQVAFQVADHEVPMLTAVDQRWRMVLDLLDDDEGEPAFSQGTVYNFRERARERGLVTLLLDRTVALARETGGFSHKRLRMLIDSSPLLGSGRVEDTFNLIGRAMAQLVDVAAREAGRDAADVAVELELTTVSAKSVKAALDVDWRLPDARNEALNTLLEQFERLRTWLLEQFAPEEVKVPPLSDALALVEELIEQDTEPDPGAHGASTRRIREGGKNRRISISDGDMRHGRKSKTKLFSGYKRHASVDADLRLILSVFVAPANVPEHEGAEPLLEDAERQGFDVVEVHHDRGYLASEALHERRQRNGLRLVSKPPTPTRIGARFNKSDFDIDIEAGTVTCKNGRVAQINWNSLKPAANFAKSGCRGCPWEERCQGRINARRVQLHPHEALLQKMSAELATPAGRQQRRERVTVEHALARLGAIQGRYARYRGVEKNQFHTTACAVVANCFVLGRLKEAA